MERVERVSACIAAPSRWNKTYTDGDIAREFLKFGLAFARVEKKFPAPPHAGADISEALWQARASRDTLFGGAEGDLWSVHTLSGRSFCRFRRPALGGNMLWDGLQYNHLLVYMRCSGLE